MLRDFRLAEKRLRLRQRTGESYEHVLMKALGYMIYADAFPQVEIETGVGLRCKPDLAARGGDDRFLFWGEAGDNSTRKTLRLLKHASVEQLVLFKIGIDEARFVKHLRDEIPARYRVGGKLILINFTSDIVRLTAAGQIEKVAADWFSKTII